jgi:hypothetical protein
MAETASLNGGPNPPRRALAGELVGVCRPPAGSRPGLELDAALVVARYATADGRSMEPAWPSPGTSP